MLNPPPAKRAKKDSTGDVPTPPPLFDKDLDYDAWITKWIECELKRCATTNALRKAHRIGLNTWVLCMEKKNPHRVFPCFPQELKLLVESFLPRQQAMPKMLHVEVLRQQQYQVIKSDARAILDRIWEMVEDAAKRGYSALECNEQEWRDSLPIPPWMGTKPWHQWKVVTAEMEKKGFQVVPKDKDKVQCVQILWSPFSTHYQLDFSDE